MKLKMKNLIDKKFFTYFTKLIMNDNAFYENIGEHTILTDGYFATIWLKEASPYNTNRMKKINRNDNGKKILDVLNGEGYRDAEILHYLSRNVIRPTKLDAALYYNGTLCYVASEYLSYFNPSTTRIQIKGDYDPVRIVSNDTCGEDIVVGLIMPKRKGGK